MKLKQILNQRIDPHAPEQVQQIKDEVAVYEGLISSASPWMVINKLQQTFESAIIKHDENENGSVIIFASIYHRDASKLNQLLKLVDVMGWYPSWWNIIPTHRPGSKFDAGDVTDALNDSNNDGVLIQFEAKYDVEELKIPSVLYHAAPYANGEKISKIGLIPKSKSTDLIYPDRIYLAKDLDHLVDVLIPQIAATKNISDWAVFQINNLDRVIPKPRLFFDPLYPHGYYTLSNIPPNRLKLIKVIQL